MKELRRFHITWLRTTTIVIGFLCAWIGTRFPGLPTKIIVSGTTLGLLFLSSEWLIRERMWRLPFFHRGLDFEGRWNCVTFYDHVETSDFHKRSAFEPYSVVHDAIIEQDTRRIQIRSSPGREYKGWKSLMMDASEVGISYAYEVEYSASSRLEGKPTGYEELEVQQRYPNSKSGLPILLVGTFAHCAAGQTEAFRGTAVFCRASHLDHISINEALEPHVREAIQKVRDAKTA